MRKSILPFSYAAHGAAGSMTLGNNLVEKTEFNGRLQPTFIKLGTTVNPTSVLQLSYEYASLCQSGNNGNVMRQTITAPGLSLTQDYCYDSLNRLSSASENSGASWSQTYGYDRYGNRWVSQSLGYAIDTDLCPTQQSQIDAATNRMNKLLMTGYDYDLAGNQIKQRRAGQNETLAYDAENHLTNFNGAVGQYFYDGDGHRVKKIDGSGTTIFVYNVGGQLIAEYHSDPVPPAAGGGGTSYLTTDHLGSTRVVTKADGTVKARYDYLPFGEELGSSVGGRTAGMGYGAADSTRQKFTQKERDNESGLDYFLARYYSSAQGRFTSPDPVRGSIGDPQTWNLYPYVTNNPLKYVDPSGRWKEIAPGIWEWEKDDTWKTLSLQTGISKKLLKKAFKGAQLGSGLVVDVRGASEAAGENISAGLSNTQITPMFAGVAREMNRRVDASNKMIGIASIPILIPAGASLTLAGGGILTLGLSDTATIAALENLALSGGPTVEVVTNLTQAPAVGEGLSVATGDGATALANSFARAGGQLFRAQIPKALIRELERLGLAETRRHASGAIEIRIFPAAARFVTRFFK